MVEIKVNNCSNCPFLVTEMDFNSIGNEVCVSCNLLKFLKLKQVEKHRFRIFGYEELEEMGYLEPLEHCPLKINSKIGINYEN